jgi:Rrf2 family protein
MALLAVEPDRLVSNRKIASMLKVSEAHLSKVLQRLHKAGYVDSIRGPKGGFRLRNGNGKVTLDDVMTAIDGPISDVTCLFDTPVCDGTNCIFGDLLEDVNHQINSYLRNTELSELTTLFRERFADA